MGKKNKKTKDNFGYYDAKEDEFEKEFRDEAEDYETDDDIGEEVVTDNEISEESEDDDQLETAKDKLSKEVLTLQNGEERTRAILDLKEIEAMRYARRRYAKKRRQMSDELRLKQNELENDLKLKQEEMLREYECKQKELAQEQEKIEKELALRKEELAQNRLMHDEDIRVQKRSTLIGTITNILLTITSLGAYSYLLDKQNKFESGDNYSTSGSRGLTNNISRIPTLFGKH